MTQKVYGMGYSGRTLSDIVRIARSLDAVIFDIRWRAGSRNPSFNKSTLQRTLGERYARARELGNVNYKGAVSEIEIADIEAGIHLIEESDKPVILLCVCKDPKVCHRTVIGQELQRRGFEYEELNAHPASFELLAFML